MPALRLFGRRWHVAADDLPPFALAGFGFHFVFAAFLAAALGLETTHCQLESWVHLQSYMAALLGVDTLQTAAMGGLIYIGMQGSILDIQQRTASPVLLYMVSLLYTVLLGVQMYGSISISFMDCQPTDGWNNASFVAAAFAFHWVAIAAFITTFLVTFNMYPDQSDPTSWRRQCTCYGRLCCLGDSATSWVKQSTSLISRALNRSFRPTRPAAKMPPRQQDMSPNKVAAAAAHSSPRHSYEPLPDRSPNTLGGSDDTKRKAPADASRAEAVGHGPLTTSGRSRSGVMRLEQMADMFFSVMSHVDLTPSDYATGLMLLGIQQHMQDHAATEAAAAAEEGHAAGAGGGGKVRDASSIVPGTATAATKAKTRQADKYWTTLPPLALSPDGPSLDTLKDAEFYFKHACAVYGWPMHLWMHKRKPAKCCSVWAGCCACCRERQNPLDVRKNMTIEAIRRATNMNPATDLLYCSTINQVEGLLPYYVALDRERREVILSVRGSMSQRDVLTDFLCFPERVDPTWIRSPAPRSDKATDKATNPAAVPDGDATAPSPSSSVSPDGTGTAPSVAPEDGEGHDKSWGGAAAQADEEEEVFAHQGVLSCALAVADDLQRTGVLRAVLECDEEARARLKDPVYQQDCRGWKLTVIGHSLGAGVAALLAMHLRTRYPNMHCWAFAPPGGLLSPAAARASRDWCTSIIIAKDMIPRLSLGSVMQMTEALVAAAARCKVSKTTLWAKTVLLRKNWTEEELFKADNQLSESDRQAIQDMRDGMETSVPAGGLSRARDFMAPGKLLYFEKQHDHHHQNASSNVLLCKPRWMTQEELAGRGLIVSKRMFAMHVPDFQKDVISQTLKRALAHEKLAAALQQ